MSFLFGSVVLYLISSLLYFFRLFTGLNFRFLPGGLLVGALFLYLAFFLKRYADTGHFPVGDIYGMVSLSGNLIVVLFILAEVFIKREVGNFGFIIAFMGFLTSLVGLPASEVGYRNPFYVYHILSAGLAYASLILGGVSSLVRIFVEKKLRSKHLGGFMIPVNLLRKMERIFMNVGFIFLTLILIFGSIWSKSYLGRHWVNDPKLILTLALWIYYALILHINLLKGIQPSKFSALSVLGMIMVLTNIALIRHTVE